MRGILRVALVAAIVGLLIAPGQGLSHVDRTPPSSLANVPSIVLKQGSVVGKSQSRAPTPSPVAWQANGTLCLLNDSLLEGNDPEACSNGLFPSIDLYDPANGDIYVADQNSGDVSVISGSTNTLVREIQVGKTPFSMALDNTSGDIYVSNEDSNNVSVISGANNAVVATIPVGVWPEGLTYDPANGIIYVANQDSDDVSLISASTFSVVATLTVGAEPWVPILDSTTGEIYVSNQNSGNVSVISGTTNKIVDSIAVEDWPNNGVYDPANGDIYFTDQDSSDVSVISGASNTVVANLAVGVGPWYATYDSGNGDIYVAVSESAEVTAISGVTNTIVANISAGSYPTDEVYDPANSAIYVTDQEGAAMSVINGSSNELSKTIPVGDGDFSGALDSGNGELYVTNYGSDSITVVSTAINASIASIPLGISPENVLFDTDNGDLYVISGYGGNDGLVSVISGRTYKPIANLSVVGEPWAMAFDPTDDTIFVTNQVNDNIAVISGNTNSVVNSVTVEATTLGAAYDPGNGDVYVESEAANDVFVISASGQDLVQSIEMKSSTYGATYDPTTGNVYVSSSPQQVYAISGATNATVGTVGVGSDPEGLCFDPADGNVYVADEGSDNISAFYDLTGKVTLTGATGSEPVSVLCDPGNGDIYVVNEGSDNLSVFMTHSSQEVASISVGANPEGSAYDPDNGTIFVADEQSGALSIIDTAASVGPTITSFIAYPSKVYLGNSTYLNVTVVGSAGGLDYTYSGLPDGCASENVSDLPCAPAVPGYFTVEVAVRDNANHTTYAFTTFDVVIPGKAPTISSFTIEPSAITLGGTTTLDVLASGGVGWLGYQYIGLPDGCSSANVSLFECEPLVTGSFNVTVYVNDSADHSVLSSGELIVSPAGVALAIDSFTVIPSNVTVNSSVLFEATVSGGVAPYSYAYSGLPTGCSSVNQASFDCAPTSEGLFAVVATVTDAERDNAQRSVELRVTGGPTGGGITITSFTASPRSVSLGGSVDLDVAAIEANATLSYVYTGLPDGCLTADVSSLVCTPQLPTLVDSPTQSIEEEETFTVRVFVNDTLDHSASSTTYFYLTFTAELPSLSIEPTSITLETSTNKVFTVQLGQCLSDGFPTCPTSVSYEWTVNNTLGRLVQAGSVATYYSGSDPGDSSIVVTATLYYGSPEGAALASVSAVASIVITVIHPSPGSDLDTILVLVVIVTAVAVGVLLTVRYRRRAVPFAQAPSVVVPEPLPRDLPTPPPGHSWEIVVTVKEPEKTPEDVPNDER